MHCFGGKSRSPAFIAAYLMSSYSWSFDQAYSLIKKARPIIEINTGFECQLRAYGIAGYDVYKAQQVLLRTRIRELHFQRGKEPQSNSPGDVASNSKNNSPTKDSKHVLESLVDAKTGDSVGLSSGQKRSWGDTKPSLTDSDLSMEVEDTNDEIESKLLDSISAKLLSSSSEKHPGISLLSSKSTDFHSSRSLNTGLSGPLGGISINTGGSSCHRSGNQTTTNRARKAQVNRGGRRTSVEIDSKTPSCRLSRPGSTAIRVIPPLRGLEQEFKCSWCTTMLFSLANVVRVDMDVSSMIDAYKAEEKITRPNAIYEDPIMLSSNKIPLTSRSVQSAIESARSIDDLDSSAMLRLQQQEQHAKAKAMGPPTPNKTQGGDLDESSNSPSSPDNEMRMSTPNPTLFGNNLSGKFSPRGIFPPINAAKGASSPPIDAGFRSPSGDMDVDEGVAYADPKPILPLKSTRRNSKSFSFDMTFDEKGFEPSSQKSITDVDRTRISPVQNNVNRPNNINVDTTGDTNNKYVNPTASVYVPGSTSSSRPGSGVRSSSYNQLSSNSLPYVTSRPSSATATSIYSPPLNGLGSHSGYDESPRVMIPPHRIHENSWSQQQRPQSAEKKRWIARVNLIREGDSKVVQMAEDDDMNSSLAFGTSKYLHIEYMDWMGREMFQLNKDIGDLCCHNCKKVVGSYIWNPSIRYVN